LLFALAGCAYVALGAAAQYVAWTFGFHPNLGPPALVLPAGTGDSLRDGATVVAASVVAVLVLSLPVRRLRWTWRFAPLVLFLCALAGGLGLSEARGEGEGVGVYSPFRFVGWGLAYGGFGETSPYFDVFTQGLLVFGGTLGAVAVALLAVRRPVGPLENTGSQGTAGWSDGEELDAEKGEGGGVLIGRRLDSPKASKRSGASAGGTLRYAGEGHLVTVAPTRSGKGTGAVIPNLLTYPGSVVVTDPKGENYAVTARRRARMGQAVRALDPFDQLGALARQMEGVGRKMPEIVQATYNPMDLIDPHGEDWLESAALLAEMLVLPSGGKGEEAFWNEEAKDSSRGSSSTSLPRNSTSISGRPSGGRSPACASCSRCRGKSLRRSWVRCSARPSAAVSSGARRPGTSRRRTASAPASSRRRRATRTSSTHPGWPRRWLPPASTSGG
jgi:type IV secretion system protein VirD4